MSKTPKDGSRSDLKPDTRLTVGGRDPFAHHGYVNPPVYHASTLLYPTAEDYLAHRGRYQYGRGERRHRKRSKTRCAKSKGPQCAGVALLPSGLAAISTALLAVLRTRRSCTGHGQRLRADAQILQRRADALLASRRLITIR